MADDPTNLIISTMGIIVIIGVVATLVILFILSKRSTRKESLKMHKKLIRKREKKKGGCTSDSDCSNCGTCNNGKCVCNQICDGEDCSQMSDYGKARILVTKNLDNIRKFCPNLDKRVLGQLIYNITDLIKKGKEATFDSFKEYIEHFCKYQNPMSMVEENSKNNVCNILLPENLISQQLLEIYPCMCKDRCDFICGGCK